MGPGVDVADLAATVVDHIIPHRGNEELFWDEDNWQGLCKRCHDRKTWREKRGLGITWEQHPERFVINGQPASGKTTAARRISRRLSIPRVWDWDAEAQHLGYDPFSLSDTEMRIMLTFRDRFVDATRLEPGILISSKLRIAREIARSLKATFVDVWCEDALRTQRMLQRPADRRLP